jgi:hypothetical protein
MRSPTARPLCRRPLGPDHPRWLALTQACLVAQVEDCSSCRAPSHGTADVAANDHPRAPG